MDQPPRHVDEVQTFRQDGTLLIDIFLDDESIQEAAATANALAGGTDGSTAGGLARKAAWDVLKRVDGATTPEIDTEVTIHSEFPVTL